jgi:hypothetical protein
MFELRHNNHTRYDRNNTFHEDKVSRIFCYWNSLHTYFANNNCRDAKPM